MSIKRNFKGALTLLLITCFSVNAQKYNNTDKHQKAPFIWEGANVYFMVTDRFNNGDNYNDYPDFRAEETAPLRGFIGGDIAGITQKIKEGYFANLGINAIWFTPVFEQSKGLVDEGTGKTYAYHGYWPRDWTALDYNFGTKGELDELVATAHASGIRVIMDVVLNHIGPTTPQDAPWPTEWVRTEPRCEYTNYENTTSCTLVENLPDVRTESDVEVELPEFLVKKWKKENRYKQEVRELDEFFARTKYPRAPKYYIIKWLTDYIKDYGIDAFRVDTVKHLEEDVFTHLKEEALYSLDFWKENTPDAVLDDNEFYMIGEVYGYGIAGVRLYDFGDKKVDYFENGFNSLINFQFSYNSKDYDYETLFSKYNEIIHSEDMEGFTVLNYLSSHDDPNCFDKLRTKPFESANKLLLCPGQSQVYYGDESMRVLEVDSAKGDANLRSFMNWADIRDNKELNGFMTKDVMLHWQKLGRFRKDHPAVGAGVHKMISDKPYVFSRVFENEMLIDKVVVGLNLPKGSKSIDVSGVFPDGSFLKDAYSGAILTVKNGKVDFKNDVEYVLLALKK